jgi:hypothetical protein
MFEFFEPGVHLGCGPVAAIDERAFLVTVFMPLGLYHRPSDQHRER